MRIKDMIPRITRSRLIVRDQYGEIETGCIWFRWFGKSKRLRKYSKNNYHRYLEVDNDKTHAI